MGLHDFPPWKTVSYYFYTWRDAGVWERLHDTRRRSIGRLLDREDTPSVGIVDTQSVKTTRAARRGVTGGKKVSGRKRHLLVDRLGLIWGPAVLPAARTDWDGAVGVYRRVGKTLPRVARVWADSNDRATALGAWTGANGRWVLEVVAGRPGQTTFEV